ncbi:MAG: hypothetical protein IJW73_06925 [Candidatus Gastranaerophilales bacterium]|nr:hypothetical protein [Candidatus Gastranaerophilales bacterium]
MTLISKAAGGLSLISCFHDIHKTAMINSNNKYAKVSSNATIASSIGNQKANKVSYKDAQRKNWLAQSQFGMQTIELSARVTGYISGFAKASVRYIPNFACAAVAILLASKSKATKLAEKEAERLAKEAGKTAQEIAQEVAKVTQNAGKNIRPIIANTAAVGLGLIELWDFIKNSTNIAQRTDYLE